MPAPAAVAAAPASAASTPAAPPLKPKPSFGDGPPPADKRQKLIVIEIKLVSSWQETCRKALELCERFPGEDVISLTLSGKQWTMDFPNQKTRTCPELIESLRMLPGVIRVYPG